MEYNIIKWDSNHKVDLITISNSNGLTIKVMNWGATLVDVQSPDSQGNIDSIIAGYDNFEDYYKTNFYFGSSVGRYANRIGKAEFELNSKLYKLTANDNENTLHGGPQGYHRRLFEYTIEETKTSIKVTFTRLSPDGEEGYPGNVNVSFSYTLNEENDLILDFDAKSDTDTYINLTNHAYWNLEGFGTDILNQELRIDADSYVEIDTDCIPTGQISSTTNSSFDFKSPITFKQAFSKQSKGFDHCFILNERPKDKVQIEAYSPKTGRKLSIWTDQPGVQLYTCSNFDRAQLRGKKDLTVNGAFCLEVQGLPDSMHHNNFPQCLVKAGETYSKQGIHKFSW
ncbi:aldose epimerase family protein [Spirochaeta cellobiosiphila]|uniref:aldose epimerase family protein n=1 Tax=Spirochaeta cellobiosiphila TaxID=504483 RepID=UPI0004108DAA|nr:aldose epimerase family protein [Spirochaeta cellobiosiphila]